MENYALVIELVDGSRHPYTYQGAPNLTDDAIVKDVQSWGFIDFPNRKFIMADKVMSIRFINS